MSQPIDYGSLRNPRQAMRYRKQMICSRLWLFCQDNRCWQVPAGAFRMYKLGELMAMYGTLYARKRSPEFDRLLMQYGYVLGDVHAPATTNYSLPFARRKFRIRFSFPHPQTRIMCHPELEGDSEIDCKRAFLEIYLKVQTRSVSKTEALLQKHHIHCQVIAPSTRAAS